MTRRLPDGALKQVAVSRARAREIVERAVLAAEQSNDYGDRRFARGVAWAMFQLGVWDEAEADAWTDRISAEARKR